MNYRWTIHLFAGLQERLGSSSIVLSLPKENMSAAELKAELTERYPDQSDSIRISFIACNQAYAQDEAILSNKDELALLPPVSGGQDGTGIEEEGDECSSRYSVTEAPLSVDAVMSRVIVPKHGASLVFVGTTREWTHGKRTVKLQYEAYVPMAVKTLQQIGDELEQRWPGTIAAISHRIGVVEIGEASVVIAVSSPHRDSCYEASRYAIERLKQIVPIWKKEVWEDGTEWQGHQQGSPWNPIHALSEWQRKD
ncbi:molybdenum cofactor biosynthesis protein MoaE [Paenibacillus sp. GCM10023252]|uniref:molybdenum cofactor biosynthesis protein n=1 Tax=Paenibacillus sp. GCM10023252 TaxID=3252649 RepID=UPI0036142309